MKFQYLPDSGLNKTIGFKYVLLLYSLTIILSGATGYIYHTGVLSFILITIACFFIFFTLFSIAIYLFYISKDAIYLNEFSTEVYEQEATYTINTDIIKFVIDNQADDLFVKINSDTIVVNNITKHINTLTAIEQVIYSRAIVSYFKNYQFKQPFYGDYVENDIQLKHTVVLRGRKNHD